LDSIVSRLATELAERRGSQKLRAQALLQPVIETGFNPLDKEALADTFVRMLSEQPCARMSMLHAERSPAPPRRYGKQQVHGAGVYAIYYSGGFEDYRPLALSKCAWPIYIGKAEAPGSRKGDDWAPSATRRGPLLERLLLHRASLELADNLDVEDFACRWLTVDDAFIVTAEVLLVKRYRPLWNAQADGFGAKAVGQPRESGRRSKWDTLHVGRKSVGGVAKHDLQDIRAEIAAHLRKFPPRPSAPYARPTPPPGTQTP
jgi:Eco29kI-like restriction endonuclease